MGRVRRGYDIATDEGLRELWSRLRTRAYWAARERYLELSSSTTLSIRDLQAEFGTDGRAPRSLCFFERKERTMLGDVLDEITPSDTFWDVGAHIGYYSCFVGQRADVIAFEPSPVAAERCRRNLNRNGIGAPVLECALSDAHDTVALPPGVVSRVESESVEVRTKRGDDLVGEVSHPTVVKMDVEGQELSAIDGMKGVLSSDRCRLFYCEVHTEPSPDRRSIVDDGETLDGFNRTIGDFGFEVETIRERDAEVHIKAKRR